MSWLRPLSAGWPGTLCDLLESEPVVVRIVVAEVRGSAPREAGACMLVSRQGNLGTIGGGRLEWQAVQSARTLLLENSANTCVRIRRLTLGPDLGQCCGGVVQTWLERFTRSDLPVLRSAARAIADGLAPCFVTELSDSGLKRKVLLPDDPELSAMPENHSQVRFVPASTVGTLLVERVEVQTTQLWLFGAGHVGQALVRVLTDLPFEVTWVDERGELLPADLPANVRALHTPVPLESLQAAPAGARYLVMTHDHALDYALCHAILERDQFAWLGLIGSKSKGARFRSRLARDRIPQTAIARMVCPIGVEGVANKWPAAIAVSVAAQLLQIAATAAGTGRSAKPPHATAKDAAPCPTGDCGSCTAQVGSAR